MASIQPRVVGLDILCFSLLQKVLYTQGTRLPVEKKKILFHKIHDICHEGRMEQEMERSSHCEEFQLYLCRY